MYKQRTASHLCSRYYRWRILKLLLLAILLIVIYKVVLSSMFEEHKSPAVTLSATKSPPKQEHAEIHYYKKTPAVTLSATKSPPKQENVEVHYYNKPPSVSLQAFSKCPDRCSMTHGKSNYKTKRIVIFHGPDLGGAPPKKYPGQLWIMQAMEPPTLFANQLKSWKRVFNWTLVHRRDSDVFTPYGSYAPVRSNSDKVTTKFDWDSKDKMAAWFVSHCNVQSRREEYVHQLQRDVSVHIYGKCGNMSCPRSTHKDCLNKLQREYKFYFAFENSLCADYITEKVSKLFQDNLAIIPVVRGTGDLYKMHLPPGSYISAHDYTIKGLAQKMKSISQSRTEFEKYFAWRNHYYVEEVDRFYCDLCKKLHSAHKYRRLYESVTDWLFDHPDHRNCREPVDIPK